MLLLLLNYAVLRALYQIDVYLISTLVNKSLYYYISLVPSMTLIEVFLTQNNTLENISNHSVTLLDSFINVVQSDVLARKRFIMDCIFAQVSVSVLLATNSLRHRVEYKVNLVCWFFLLSFTLMDKVAHPRH